ncbi:MAG: phosphomannomutase/phosphoglucomutase, partial [Candidatus Diapherotrites archaeon]|nr:phosphomannomutase/phosphoglucomutase [Candidatus Diapherotrites archaeon]
VGRDMRTSSKPLFDALCKGITGQGADVIDIGLVSTDMVYFAVGNYGFDAGVIITASHNPGKDNGLKICKKSAVPVGGDSGLEEIKRLVIASKFAPTAKKGKIIEKDALSDYAAKCLSLVKPKTFRPLLLVIDAGNGMAGKTWPAIQDRIPCKTIPLYFELDGTFPNHVPNPLLPENIVALQNEVKKQKADVGIAFDGDADRCFLVDEKGTPVSGSETTALLSRYFLNQPPNRGAKILYDLRCSKIVPEIIAVAGGTPVLTRVGHAFIKKIMAENGAVFGGELSGHYYFRDNYNADSGMIAALILLQIISDENKPLSQILAPLRRKWFHSGEINFTVKNKEKKMNELKAVYGPKGKLLELDGVSIDFGNWWFNARASNTEPFLRLNLEADSKKLRDEKLAEISALLKK